MADQYRTLIQSLMGLGFLFRRVGERKQEVWRNRITDQEVMFDRHEVDDSPALAAKVLQQAKAAKPGEKALESVTLTPPGRTPAGRPMRQSAGADVGSSVPAKSKASTAPKARAVSSKRKTGTAKSGPGRRPR